MDFLIDAPRYFVNCCIEAINDEARRIDKENKRRAVQDVIRKMKGR